MAAPRYSADELVAAAGERGFRATKRLIADWVAIGLLDRGTDRGLGRGKGKRYGWSENQLRLFLVLLEKRAGASRPTLANIPVALWLIWGDSYVPLRQARRALATWTRTHDHASADKSMRTARQVIAELDHPGATRAARKHLRELVASAARGDKVDTNELLEAARNVYDPEGSRPPAGPTRMTPEAYVRVLQARLTAIRHLTQEPRKGPGIPDAAFADAREMYLATGPVSRQAAAPLDRDSQVLAPPLMSYEAVVNSACLHLLTLVGFWLVSPNRLPIQAAASEAAGG